ncbi:hypothetical protein PLICRDRAFT_160024 [Plicaturopsis crispa FD-325 SS-3]|nr:hypothetical protein PLICRDRAFT_160024 [Plicaturopsis crispa FD-325 SS-3]
MHRFRKKSDAKRSPVPEYLRSSSPHEHIPDISQPELPPASNFRTSLILPDLTRRFTLLRSSTGSPVSLEALKDRFAEQRARGAENQISEEEEDMILETLGRMRSNGTANTDLGEPADSDYQASNERQSVRSSNTVDSDRTYASSSARPAKRYSNNMFGSGRFRDHSYVRSVTSQKSGSSRTPTESSYSARGKLSTYSNSDSLRPTTPEGNGSLSSNHSSPSEKPVARSAPLFAPAPYSDNSESEAEYRLSRALNPKALRRASLALEEAIKEMEEETTEDEIVMPRSAPISRGFPVEQTRPQIDTDIPDTIQQAVGMAVSSPKPDNVEVKPQPSSPTPLRPSASPSPRVPGYVPGMPRPMTPRDTAFDSDDQLSRSHSTTPRASSPSVASHVDKQAPVIPSTLPSSILRRGSNASNRHTAQSGSASSSTPMFLPRTLNGRLTPDDHRADSFAQETENALASIAGRRRPASPLSGLAFQPMTVSSRPSTPSSITWNPSSNNATHARAESSMSGYSRNGSLMSSEAGGMHTDMQRHIERSKSVSRSLRSPALPDSPLLDHGSDIASSAWNESPSQSGPDNRRASLISGVELGSPLLLPTNGARSDTPTQSSTRSPTSPSFPNNDLSTSTGTTSRRSSKQNRPSSPFTLTPVHPLVFSPVANSSRSSLESAGSSYHSWDAENKKDRTLDLFTDADSARPAWHDISGQSSSATPADSPDDEWDAEDIIRRYAGLTKSDFTAIQETLVSAATTKSTAPEVRERVPSLRRRRPSTSMSNHSASGQVNRVASPSPRAPSPASPTLRTDFEAASKVHKVPSIQQTVTINTSPAAGLAGDKQSTDAEISPTERHRDLARMIFGAQESVTPISPAVVEPVESQSPSTPANGPSAVYEETPSLRITDTRPSASAPDLPELNRSPITPRTPVNIGNEVELARDVQRRADAAMMALRKSPSNQKLGTVNSSGGSVYRKKINANQISEPRLVSASTSVDTIPLRSPSSASGQPPQQAPGASKIGSRFRRLRGTIRKPPVLTGDEITPFPLNAAQQSPPLPQSARYQSESLQVPHTGSGIDQGRYKVPIPSPPATSGPGLKGFMSRFRKSRPVGLSELERRGGHSPSGLTPTSAYPFPQDPPGQYPRQSQSAPATKDTFHSPSSSDDAQRSPHIAQAAPRISGQSSSRPNTGQATDDAALRQLFDAASNLGLDQAALNELLARSPSTSSKSTGWTMLTRNNSVAPSSRPQTRDSEMPERTLSPITSPVASPMPSEGPSNGNELSSQQASEPGVQRLAPRKRAGHLRPSRDGADRRSEVNAIVRRTIIYPSETRSSTIDLNVLIRKNSARRRSQGAASVGSGSGRSVHDRVPTPPPPRSPTSRRFSADRSPPVPHLPPSFTSQGENLLAPPSAMEKANSTYDSLYEFYSGADQNDRSQSNGENMPTSESGPAVEVIELANGETIWSIVNGLRDDDLESNFGSRASFASEYSLRDTSADAVQVFFKDHTRKTSKDSNSSYVSRSKKLAPPGAHRPETKVFYSSSAQIGRLIENMSQGMEAGSFNIMPDMPTTHSHSSSFQSGSGMHWTVEERLEHMIGAMENS